MPRSVSVFNKTDFPRELISIPDAPEVLYGRGDPTLLTWEPKIAVIGSRHPTDYGIRVAQNISRDLARVGVCVVSGLARGIDGMAHEAALAVHGKTIAVLGTAIDELYPACNRSLGKEIIAKGLILSEHAAGTEWRTWYFSARNRIISGLSRALVIVEAAAQSGTLITADYALKQGREVFVVPGPVDSKNSQGTLALLRNGARPVRSAADILEDLDLVGERLPAFENKKPNEYNRIPPATERGGSAEQFGGKDGSILGSLGTDPVHIDHLIDATGLPHGEMSQALLDLEIAGDIKKLPGQYYVRS